MSTWKFNSSRLVTCSQLSIVSDKDPLSDWWHDSCSCSGVSHIGLLLHGAVWHIPASGLSVRKGSNRLCPALDLTAEPLDDVVCPNTAPVLCMKIHISEVPLCHHGAFLLRKRVQRFCYLTGFLACCFPALLGMDRFQHRGNWLHFVSWCDREDIPVKSKHQIPCLGCLAYLWDALKDTKN